MDVNDYQYIVSFVEVDEAVRNLFLSLTKIDGTKINPKSVRHYTPDADLETAKVEFPAVAFYSLPPFKDVERANNSRVFIDSPVLNGEGMLVAQHERIFPEPYSSIYHVEFVSDSIQEIKHIQSQLARLLLRDDYVTIKDVNYWITDLGQGSVGGAQYKEFGEAKGNRRRFTIVYSYRLDYWFEMGVRTKVTTAQEITTGERKIDNG